MIGRDDDEKKNYFQHRTQTTITYLGPAFNWSSTNKNVKNTKTNNKLDANDAINDNNLKKERVSMRRVNIYICKILNMSI